MTLPIGRPDAAMSLVFFALSWLGHGRVPQELRYFDVDYDQSEACLALESGPTDRRELLSSCQATRALSRSEKKRIKVGMNNRPSLEHHFTFLHTRA